MQRRLELLALAHRDGHHEPGSEGECPECWPAR